MKGVAGRRGRHFSVVDMFCGAGGLTFGLETTGAFRTLLGLDASDDALKTFTNNHGTGRRRPKTISGDLADLDPLEIRRELRKLGVLTGQLDVLVGGPPCEGFSQNHGKALAIRGKHDFLSTAGHATRAWYRPRNRRSRARKKQIFRSKRNDKRNHLFRAMLDVMELIRPRIVLIENVRELLTHNDGAIRHEIEACFEAAGYKYEIRILNAADFGVPQIRKRAFIVAVRNDVAVRLVGKAFFPDPTHRAAKSGDDSLRLTGNKGIYVTTYEAIGDLPAPSSNGSRRSSKKRKKVQTTQFRRYVRDAGSLPTLHVHRPVGDQVLKRITALKPGMKINALPAKLRTKKFYASAYARLEWTKPANTITKSFNNLGSGKFCHPRSNRGITVREAARLQSFPDSFEFFGESWRSIYAQIGSAVPPLLARAFGLHFTDLLRKANKPSRKKKTK
jgi:DNA (cytosine-5)-methyltransferase 1